MELTGHKQHANVILNIVTYTLLVDVGNDVIKVQYKSDTMLSHILQDINTILSEYGYKPKQVKSIKIKPFKFK